MHHKVFGIIKGTVLPNLVKKWKYCLYSGSAPANFPFYTVRSFFSFGPAREFFVVQKFITKIGRLCLSATGISVFYFWFLQANPTSWSATCVWPVSWSGTALLIFDFQKVIGNAYVWAIWEFWAVDGMVLSPCLHKYLTIRPACWAWSMPVIWPEIPWKPNFQPYQCSIIPWLLILLTNQISFCNFDMHSSTWDFYISPTHLLLNVTLMHLLTTYHTYLPSHKRQRSISLWHIPYTSWNIPD